MDACDVGGSFACRLVDISLLIKGLDVVSCKSDVMTSVVNGEVDSSSLVDEISIVASGVAGCDVVNSFVYRLVDVSLPINR